jgi:hypothetical protein
MKFEGKYMCPIGFEGMTLEEYRALEVELHRDLMKVCRKYINELGIVSIMGILDIVKQESMELEKATSKIMKGEELTTEDKNEDDGKDNVDPSLREQMQRPA